MAWSARLLTVWVILPSKAPAQAPQERCLWLPAVALASEPQPLAATYLWPTAADKTISLLVLAHGAGANHRHQNMHAIAQALAAQGIATLRFNFPFMEAGKRRVDSVAVATLSLSQALAHASAELSQKQLPATLLLGGHSFGGRMATHLAATAELPEVTGLVLCSFPLHTAGKPAVKRAAHLPAIQQPMLFVSGTRDALAEVDLLEQTLASLPLAQLHWLATANHGYTILKRTRDPALGDVFAELAVRVRSFALTLS
jgi:predicted alpha/beta-hydrolase family hydrolase